MRSQRDGPGRRSPESPRVRGDAERYARLGKRMAVFGIVLLVVVLAVQELRSRGTGGNRGSRSPTTGRWRKLTIGPRLTSRWQPSTGATGSG
jgi:hypothetical protein